MPTMISAANRLRNKVLQMPGMVLMCDAGHPDKVISFKVLPECLKQFKREGENYIFLNMNRGPDQQAWSEAMDITRRNARRDRPIPDPVEVAKDSHEDWAIGEEDVPIIENAIEIPTVLTAPPVEKEVVDIWVCDLCNKQIKSAAGLSAHKRTIHKGA